MMKLIMIEATAEELRANKRVVDTIVDVLNAFTDSIVKVDIPEDKETKADEELQ